MAGYLGQSQPVAASGNSVETDDIKDGAVTDVKLNSTTLNGLQAALDAKLDDSQVLTNVPSGALFTDTVYTHPSTHTIAETSGLQSALDTKTTPGYVDSAVAGIVDSAPATLNTLNELAAALGDDANHVTTMTNLIGTKLSLSGGTLTGNLDVTGHLSASSLTLGNYEQIYWSSTTLMYGHETNGISFLTQGATRLKIQDNGNVGIGTSSPLFPLDVSAPIGSTIGQTSTYNYGSNRNWALRTNNYGSSNWGGWSLEQSAGQDLVPSVARIGVHLNGNVGINMGGDASSGLTSINPATALHVGGDITVGCADTVGASGTASIRFQNDNERSRITSNYDSGGGGRLGFWTDTTGGTLVERLTIKNTGNVGIGTSSPDVNSALEVNGRVRVATGSTGLPALSGFSDLDTGFSFPGSNVITASTGGSERMRIDASGNVGIGSASDGAILQLDKASTSYLDMQTDSVLRTRLYNDSSQTILETTTNNLIFKSASTERMRITSTGRVLVGDSSPDYTSYKTVISGNGSSDSLALMYDGSAGTSLLFDCNAADGTVRMQAEKRTGAFPDIQFYTGGSEKLRLDSAGNMGLGVTPESWSGFSGVLQIGDSASLAKWNGGGNNLSLMNNLYYNSGWKYLDNGKASVVDQSDGRIIMRIAGDNQGGSGTAASLTTVMTIDNSGNTIIGDHDLYVGATGNTYNISSGKGIRIDGAAGNVQIARENNTPLFVNRTGTDGTTISIRNNGSEVGTISVSGTGTLYNTGNGGGIDFSGNSNASGMSSEVLDDYEEGTWDVQDQSGAGISITTNRANYRKVGAIVYASCSVQYPTTGSASMVALSLPFSSDVSSYYAGDGSVGYQSTGISFVPVVQNGGSYVLFYRAGTQNVALNSEFSGRRIDFTVVYSRT